MEAYPTVRFSIDSGSSGATVSGAGPDDETNGAQARNHSSDLRKIGLYDSGPVPDIAEVPFDGSGVLRVGNSWRRVIEIKDIDHSLHGSMTAGYPQLAGLENTTEVSPGDLVKVDDAGPAGGPLYSAVLTVDGSTQLTLEDDAVGTVSGVAVRIPQWILVDEDFPELSSDTTWACGGKIRSPLDATGLWGDLRGGWRAQLEPSAIGNSYDFGDSTVNLTSGGDATGGLVILEGAPGGPLPRIVGDPGNELFAFRCALLKVRHLEMVGCKQGILVDDAAAEDGFFEDLWIHGTGVTNAIEFSAAADGGRFRIAEVDCRDHTGAGIKASGPVSLAVENSFFLSAAGNAIHANGVAGLRVRWIGVAGGNYGVLVEGAAPHGGVGVEDSILDGCGMGVSLSAAAAKGAVVRNDQLTNISGTALTIPDGAHQLAAVLDYNNFWGNSQDRNGPEPGAHDTALDPKYRDRAAWDWRPGLAPRGVGYPQAFARGLFPVSHDIGPQHQDPVGGSIIAKLSYLQDLHPDEYGVGVSFIGGNVDGIGWIVRVPKAGIRSAGEPTVALVVAAVQAALRDNPSIEALAGREVLI